MSDSTPLHAGNTIVLCVFCAPKIREAAGTAREVPLCDACSAAAERATRLPRMPMVPLPPPTVNEINEKRAALGLPPLAHVDNPGVTAPRVGSLVDEIIAEAAAAEREACAKIAAEWVAMTQWDADEPGEQIATLIRARGAR